MLLVWVVVVLLLIHRWLEVDRFSGKADTIICLFFAGSALQRLRMIWPTARGDWLTLGGALLFVMACWTAKTGLLYCSFALLIFGLSYEQGFIARLFSSRILVYGGVISFSVYMTHSFVQKLAIELLQWFPVHGGLTGILILCLWFAAVLGAAALMHHLVEAPSNRWLRKFRTGSTAVQTAVKTC
jgi:peptidoglycan/LPS O-acetylase OafA/YrhL